MVRPSDICNKRCLAGCGDCCQKTAEAVLCTAVWIVFLGVLEFILGLTSHFSSDWVKEHKISIDGGPPQTMKLFEICENWPPRPNVTKGCPDIDEEYAFIGIGFVSIILPWLLRGIELGMEIYFQQVFKREMILGMIGLVMSHIGLVITAILYIKSGRQSGRIIGKEVVILDGPYNMQDALKIATGSIVIFMCILRMLLIFLPSEMVRVVMGQSTAGSTDSDITRRIRDVLQMIDILLPPRQPPMARVHPEILEDINIGNSDSDILNHNV